MKEICLTCDFYRFRTAKAGICTKRRTEQKDEWSCPYWRVNEALKDNKTEKANG